MKRKKKTAGTGLLEPQTRWECSTSRKGKNGPERKKKKREGEGSRPKGKIRGDVEAVSRGVKRGRWNSQRRSGRWRREVKRTRYSSAEGEWPQASGSDLKRLNVFMLIRHRRHARGEKKGYWEGFE